MSPSSPAPKRARSSREPWRPPRDRAELLKAIGAGAGVVVISIGAVLFLGRDHLGGDSTPTTPVPTVPADGSSTTTTPGGSTPGATTAPTVPGATPDSSAPQGSETTPSTDPAVTTTLPGAPTP